MTDVNSPARVLAGNLAYLFAALPEVEAVAFGGSQSAGAADALSDIDLYVYTRTEIPMIERQAIVARSGGATKPNIGLPFWGPSDEWFDLATGIEVDIVYFDVIWMERQIRRVIHEHQASLGYTTCFWRTVQQSQRFFDRNGWFQTLQQQCQAEYPEALQRNIVALNHPVLRNVIPSYLHQLEKAVQRQDRVNSNRCVTALLASYFDVIFALNRVLHPGEKRLVALARRECAKLPIEMAADINALLYTVATIDDRIVTQVYTLVDRLDRLLEQEGFDSRAWT